MDISTAPSRGFEGINFDHKFAKLVHMIEVACWMYTGERQSTRIRTKYLESLLHQEVAFFDSQSVGSSGLGSGQVVSRIAEDTLLVQEAVGEKVVYIER